MLVFLAPTLILPFYIVWNDLFYKMIRRRLENGEKSKQNVFDCLNNNRTIFGHCKSENNYNRRSLLPIMSLDDGGLQGAGWCFQSAEELSGTVNAYIDFHCPDLSPLKGMQIFQKRETDHEKDDAVYASAGSESDEFVHE